MATTEGKRKGDSPTRPTRTRARRKGPTTEARQGLFVDAYIANGGNVAAAARAAGISRKGYYVWCEKDEFKARMAEARIRAREAVLDEIIRRGIEGYDEPLTHKGRISYTWSGKGKGRKRQPVTIRKFSDACLQMLHRQHFPDAYQKGRLDLGGVPDQPIQVVLFSERKDKAGE